MREALVALLTIAAPGYAQESDTRPSHSEALLILDDKILYGADSVLESTDRRRLRPEYAELTGAVIESDSTGAVRGIRCYALGNASGSWCTIDSMGHVTELIVFEGTTERGNYLHWYPNGVLHKRGPISWDNGASTRIFRGMTEGTHETFYSDGIPRQVIEYRDGHLFTALDYYPNGQLSQYRRDSLQILTCRQWCPDGRKIGDLTADRRQEEFKLRGTFVFAHRRSGETFVLSARRGRFHLKSNWDGEVLATRKWRELADFIEERDLDDGSYQNDEELPWMMRYRICEQ